MLLHKNQVTTVFLVSFLFFTPCLTTSITNTKGDIFISEAEAIDIALADPQIVSWLENNNFIQIDDVDYHYIDQLWEIIIETSNNGIITLVSVVVLEETREVASVVFLEDPVVERERYRIEQSLDIEEAEALNYFEAHPSTQEFYLNNFIFSVSYTGNNKFVLHGYNTSRWQGFQIFGYIGFNTTADGSSQFHLIKIRSNFDFGNNELKIGEVEGILFNDSIVQEFISNYPTYELDIKSVQYFDSFYHNYNNSYGFEVRFSDTEGFTAEYLNSVNLLTSGRSMHYPTNYNYIKLPYAKINFHLTSSTKKIDNVYGMYFSLQKIKAILDTVFLNDTIEPWITNISRFEANLRFHNQEVMIISIDGMISSDTGDFTLNITSNSLMNQEITKSQPQKSTEAAIYEIASSSPEIIEFMMNNEIVYHQTLYNTNGTWLVDFYNPMISMNSVQVLINDTTGIIDEVKMSDNYILPNLKTEDIVNLVLSTEFLFHFSLFPDSKLLFFYNIQHYWTVYLYSQLFPNNYYRILIDDDDGIVFREAIFYFGVGNETSFSEAKQAFNEAEKVTDFRKNYPESYETIYFLGEWTFYTESITSQSILNQLIVRLDENSNYSSVESNSLALRASFITPEYIDFLFGRSFWYYDYRFKNLNEKFVDTTIWGGFEQLGKLYTLDMIDLVEDGYFDHTTILQKENDDNLNFPLLGIIAIGGLIALLLILKIKNKSGK